MERVRPSRSNCCHADVFPIVIGTAADSPRLPHAHFLPPLISHQQNARGHMPRDFAPPILTVGCTRLGGRPASREMCRHVFPRFCCRGVHTATPRDLECPLLLHVPRVPAVILPPRSFSCCCKLRVHDHAPVVGLWLLLCLPASAEYHPPCAQPRLHHRRVRTMVVFTIGEFRRWWYNSPPWCTSGGWRLIPTGLTLVARIRGWSSSQPAHREQGLVPLSSPIKLHRSLLFFSSRVFVSPMQSVLTPGQSTDRWFSCLVLLISHRVGDKAE